MKYKKLIPFWLFEVIVIWLSVLSIAGVAALVMSSWPT